MHQSTRRQLCRMAFLLGCVLPTFCTLGWVTYRQSGWSKQHVEASLSDIVGLQCEISRYYNPRPGKWIFQDFRLKKAGRNAVTVPVLRAEEINGTWHFSADRTTVDWQAGQRLWETLQEGILLGDNETPAIKLSIAKVDWTGVALPPLQNVAVGYPSHIDGGLDAQGELADAQGATPVAVSVRQIAHGEFAVQLKTGEAGISAEHLAQLVPHLGQLGIEANYWGEMTFQVAPSQPSVALSGILRNLDLQHVLESRFQQHGIGKIDLGLESVVVRHDQLVHAKGWIVGENGQFSARLLDRATQHLQLTAYPPTGLQDLVAYRDLAVSFEIDQGHMKLNGHCRNMPAGTMLAGLSHPLVVAGKSNSLPATHLANVFYDQRPTLLPASQPSVELARWLTVPMIAENPGTVR